MYHYPILIITLANLPFGNMVEELGGCDDDD